MGAKMSAKTRSVTGQTALRAPGVRRELVPSGGGGRPVRQVPVSEHPAPSSGAASLGNRARLQLVTDHGRLVNPGFVPGEAVWVAGRDVRNEGGKERDGSAARRPPADTARRAVDGAARRTAGEAARPAMGDATRLRAAGRSMRSTRDPREAGTGPVRLTRRGRLVITSALVMLIAAIAMVLAGAA